MQRLLCGLEAEESQKKGKKKAAMNKGSAKSSFSSSASASIEQNLLKNQRYLDTVFKITCLNLQVSSFLHQYISNGSTAIDFHSELFKQFVAIIEQFHAKKPVKYIALNKG